MSVTESLGGYERGGYFATQLRLDDGTRPAIVTPSETTTWSQLWQAWQERQEALQSLAGQRIGLPLTADAAGLATLMALDAHQANVFLMDAQLPADEVRRLATSLRLTGYLLPAAGEYAFTALDVESPGGTQPSVQEADSHGVPAPATSASGGVTILTSGTEGRPKAARHTWHSLARPVRVSVAAAQRRWLLSYRVHLYAGLQVVLQSMLNHGTLVAPTPAAAPDDIVRLMCNQRVDCASATPSYWRRLVLFSDQQALRAVPLTQITLGGEVVDQEILTALADRYPRARIAHIYATTELGRCFSVTDGKAGFPTSFLEQPTADGVSLRVVDGELQVQSANAMAAYDPQATAGVQLPRFDSEGWFHTGDLVDVVDDRVYFVGRRGDMINVGGNKVHPLAVERVIRQVAGVRDVRVFAQSSSIAGQLVACEVVIDQDQTESEVVPRIQAVCQQELASFQRPRFVRIVPALPLSDAGKTSRREHA